MKVFFIFTLFLSFQIFGAALIKVQGKVHSFDDNEVVVKTEKNLITIPTKKLEAYQIKAIKKTNGTLTMTIPFDWLSFEKIKKKKTSKR